MSSNFVSRIGSCEEVGNEFNDAGLKRQLEPPTRRALLLGGLLAPALLIALPIAKPRAAAPRMVSDIPSYQDALAQVAEEHRFALIDIRADWCEVCHRIEREILSHRTVRQHLEKVPLVKIDVTAMDEPNRQLLSHLRASGPPTFFVVEALTGQEYAQTRSLGGFRRNDLIRRLRPFSQAS